MIDCKKTHKIIVIFTFKLKINHPFIPGLKIISKLYFPCHLNNLDNENILSGRYFNVFVLFVLLAGIKKKLGEGICKNFLYTVLSNHLLIITFYIIVLENDVMTLTPHVKNTLSFFATTENILANLFQLFKRILTFLKITRFKKKSLKAKKSCCC